MFENIKVGFIGFGNMATAMADGFLKLKVLPGKQMYAGDKNYDMLVNKCKERGMHACQSNIEVVECSDIVILAVKPYLIESVVSEFKDMLKGKMVVSFAWGYHYEMYQKIIPDIHYICTIPSTPVSIGEGIVIAEKTNSLNEDELKLFKDLFSKVALVEFVETSQLSIGGTIGGCGPAFGALFIEALADAGVKYGLTRESSYRLASQMLAGVSKMQLSSGKHPGVLKDEVCSPGGSTIKGVCALEENRFRYAVISAIDAIEKK